MEVSTFEEIQTEFMQRVTKAVYCNMATVDRKGRPRSRMPHPIWDGPTGWVIQTQFVFARWQRLFTQNSKEKQSC